MTTNETRRRNVREMIADHDDAPGRRDPKRSDRRRERDNARRAARAFKSAVWED